MTKVESKSSHFNPIDILPEGVIINSARSHLYRIGLSLFPSGCVKRDRFHNLLFIFISKEKGKLWLVTGQGDLSLPIQPPWMVS